MIDLRVKNVTEEIVKTFLMASPTIDTFCCVVDSSGVGIDTKLDFRVDFYTIVCIASSIFSICGAVFQLLPRPARPVPAKRLQYSGKRQRSIISWLAFADLQASLGILVRSIYWLMRMSDDLENNNGGLFCALVSGWIQYFYTATYFWNLCYAIDVYLVLRQKEGKSLFYHLCSWGLPAITASVGLSILYKPNLNCQHDVVHVLPNYLCAHIPLLMTMIANPILYFLSTRRVAELLARSCGQFSYQEHVVADALKHKFFDIVLVFYICWLPNVINSILLWTMWYDLLSIRGTIITVWYIMAVLNPLQAVLNSLVYRSWEGYGGLRMLVRNLFKWRRPLPTIFGVSGETATLESEHDSISVTERRPLVVNSHHQWYGEDDADRR